MAEYNRLDRGNITEPLILSGDLWLRCQEGGFASDAFVFKEREPEDMVEILVGVLTNLHLGELELDDAVAEHFGAKRIRPPGDRHIGLVRITIKRLREET